LRAFADGRLFGGDNAGALLAYATLVRLEPRDLDSRLRVADALLALGEVQHAAIVYAALARHAAHAGFPLRALVALKMLSALEPQLGTLLGSIAAMYCKGSPRLGRGVRLAPVDPNVPLPSNVGELLAPVPLERLVGGAQALAADTTPIGSYPEHVPAIPLFSDLPADAFAAVLGALKLVRTRPGDIVLSEGSTGTAFYVLARGSVRVSREGRDGTPVPLALLHDGSIFGEMALVAAAPRSATVVAITDCDLLEFDRHALGAASREIETVARALDKFTRERLLNNLLSTAPLFRPLGAKDRIDLIRRFTAHDVAAGATIIREGEPGQGLFVVMSGEVDISKIDGEQKILLATLRPGDVFGEISLIHDAPTSATVTAATNSTVMFLARDYFQRLVQAIPEIRRYVESLSEERLMDTRILMAGDPEELEATVDEAVRL